MDRAQRIRWRAPAAAFACLSIAASGCSEAPTESGTAGVEAEAQATPEAEAEPPLEAKAAIAAAESVSAEAQAALQEVMRAYTEDALALLKRTSDFLGQQRSLRFEAHVGFDVVQLNGQKLEFGGTRKVALRRPDRLRIEAAQRNRDEKTFFFDGETISVDLPTENAYVSVTHPGSLDAALDYLVDELGTPAPLNDFLSSDLFSEVKDGILSGFYVDEETIGEQRCHHLAFRLSEVDVQLWIEEGERPLPCRVVVTYKRAEGSPQFWAQFHDWDLSPETPDELFAYVPPEDAERLPLQAAIREIKADVEGR